MSAAANLELVRQWVEQLWNQGTLDLLNRFHSPSFKNQGRPSNIEEAK